MEEETLLLKMQLHSYRNPWVCLCVVWYEYEQQFLEGKEVGGI